MCELQFHFSSFNDRRRAREFIFCPSNLPFQRKERRWIVLIAVTPRSIKPLISDTSHSFRHWLRFAEFSQNQGMGVSKVLEGVIGAS